MESNGEKPVAGLLSRTEVQELWKKREELDEKTFRLMIDSVADPYAEYVEESSESSNGLQSKIEFTEAMRDCPFSGLPADKVMCGYYGSTWLDFSSLAIHHSVIDDLLRLAQRVGAGIEALFMAKNVRSEFREILTNHL